MQLNPPGAEDELPRIRIRGGRDRPVLAQMDAHLVHRLTDVLDSLAGDVLALLGHDDAANVARHGLISLR